MIAPQLKLFAIIMTKLNLASLIIVLTASILFLRKFILQAIVCLHQSLLRYFSYQHSLWRYFLLKSFSPMPPQNYFGILFKKLVSLSLLSSILIASNASAKVLYQWVQLTPSASSVNSSTSSNPFNYSIRAITNNNTCPNLNIGQHAYAMSMRALPNTAFPVTTCELNIAADSPLLSLRNNEQAKAKNKDEANIATQQTVLQPISQPILSIAGIALPLLPSVHLLNNENLTIASLGDTGCRLKGKLAQACNDPDQFPLAKISQLMASHKPDLIIHNGDFHYREKPCPIGSNCVGSPYGDNWDTWQADWLKPGQALMDAAPLVFIRGNHESCGRASEGWFRFLDPYPYRPSSEACVLSSADDFTQPYIIRLAKTAFVVFDSSYADDRHSQPEALYVYQQQWQSLLPILQAMNLPTILLTHRPVYGPAMFSKLDENQAVEATNYSQQLLFKDGLPAPIVGILSGHVHNFQLLSPLDKRFVPQIIAGHGGSAIDFYRELYQSGPIKIKMANGEYLNFDRAFNQGDFGFITMKADENGYQIKHYNANNVVLDECQLSFNNRQAQCVQMRRSLIP